MWTVFIKWVLISFTHSCNFLVTALSLSLSLLYDWYEMLILLDFSNYKTSKTNVKNHNFLNQIISWGFLDSFAYFSIVFCFFFFFSCSCSVWNKLKAEFPLLIRQKLSNSPTCWFLQLTNPENKLPMRLHYLILLTLWLPQWDLRPMENSPHLIFWLHW